MRFVLKKKLLLQIRKNDFIKHIKQSNLMTEFKQTDPGSDLHWQKIICLAFRSFHNVSRVRIVTLLQQQLLTNLFSIAYISQQLRSWSNRAIPFRIFAINNDFFRIFDTCNDFFRIFDTNNDFFRIFDTNNDGFIDKREFKWMTTSTVISPEVIQTVFQVTK